MRWILALSFCILPAFQAAAEDLIRVDVRVIDINKTKLHKVGLDWSRLLEGRPGVSAPGGPLNLLEEANPPLERLGEFSRGQIDAFLRVIQENNYGKLLAEPKLVTVSGSSADFIVGGEIPVVSQDSQGRTDVSWKQYGVKLSIKPERKDAGIKTHVRAEASSVDAEHAVSLPNGTYMPAIKTRSAEADVEMESRSTIMIAGLLQTNDVTISSGVPLLMDLPLLGWLFRSTRKEKSESELVIFVTPSFVTPQPGVGGK
jgi:pilus assembly protein CpaC